MDDCRQFLRKMFEHDETSDEERSVIAGILGNSVEDCRKEWSKQFRLEYATDPVHHPTGIDTSLDASGKTYIMSVQCIRYNNHLDDIAHFKRLSLLAGNIDAYIISDDSIDGSSFLAFHQHGAIMSAVVKFDSSELSYDDVKDLYIGIFGNRDGIEEQISSAWRSLAR